MYNQNYEISYNDMNPTFLFTCKIQRIESECNYHSHDHVELVFIFKGQGTFHIDGTDYPVKTGDLVILNPGTYHKSLVSCPQDPAVEFYVGFSGIHLRGSEPDFFPLAGRNVIVPLKDGHRQEVSKICSAMIKEAQSYRPGQYFMLKAYLIQLILLLVREEQDHVQEQDGFIFESPNKKYVVNQMIRYFSEHYQEKISLDQIAQNMYLSKLFKKHFGMPPSKYRIRNS